MTNEEKILEVKYLWGDIGRHEKRIEKLEAKVG